MRGTVADSDETNMSVLWFYPIGGSGGVVYWSNLDNPLEKLSNKYG